MADQTVRIENLALNGSAERVAYDIYVFLRPMITVKDLADATQQHLELYAKCVKTVRAGYFDKAIR